MKKKKMLMLVTVLVVAIAVEAKFMGWGTNYVYSYVEDGCLIKMANQTHYFFWFRGATESHEIGRLCTGADHGSPSTGPTTPHTAS